MRIVRPALMMVTHSQTPWTVENGGTGMVPRSILLVLTDDERADSGDGGLRVRRCWSGAIIELLGEHDLTMAETVEDCLGDALAGGPVVVDLSAAALIDCSILGVLRRAADLNGAHGMVVCAPPGTFPRRVIDIASSSSNLDIPVYDTRGQALCAAAMRPT
jgi:anti-anti-sigma regulatory factor